MDAVLGLFIEIVFYVLFFVAGLCIGAGIVLAYFRKRSNEFQRIRNNFRSRRRG